MARRYSDDAVRAIMVTAYEQGLEWAKASAIRPPETERKPGAHWYDDIVGIDVREVDERTGEEVSRHRVSLATLDRAMVAEQMEPCGYRATYGPADVGDGGADCIVADVIVQRACFGEIRYG